jgi:hypothetical protein
MAFISCFARCNRQTLTIRRVTTRFIILRAAFAKIRCACACIRQAVAAAAGFMQSAIDADVMPAALAVRQAGGKKTQRAGSGNC